MTNTNTDGWIGVDFDGTLAHYDGWDGGSLGVPIGEMVFRVKRWLSEGRDVRIFTARISDGDPSVVRAIEDWCLEHIGQVLPITNVKDYKMIELWDDRAVTVRRNIGDQLTNSLIDGAAPREGVIPPKEWVEEVSPEEVLRWWINLARTWKFEEEDGSLSTTEAVSERIFDAIIDILQPEK